MGGFAGETCSEVPPEKNKRVFWLIFGGGFVDKKKVSGAFSGSSLKKIIVRIDVTHLKTSIFKPCPKPYNALNSKKIKNFTKYPHMRVLYNDFMLYFCF